MNHTTPNIVSKVPAQEEIQFLEDMIYEYNADITKRNGGELFSKLIYNAKNNIIAGISGWTWAGIGEITQLWVQSNYRNKGYGSILLQAAEAEAKNKNCKTLILRTYSFQSPLFYQKYGYRVEFEIKDFPKGHSHFCLIKKLTE